VPVVLEGGCRVTGLREGAPTERVGLRIWRHFDRTHGSTAISLRVLEFAPGLSEGHRNAVGDEVFYVLEGEATLLLDGHPDRISPDTGFYLRPGQILSVDNPGPRPLTVVSSRCPDPGEAEVYGPACTEPSGPVPVPYPCVRLRDRAPERSGDRWYRVLVDEKAGSAQVTQFVGAIPRGRAPDHFHEYEEVLCILAGRGRMWAGKTSAPIEAGSCIFLPRRQLHCVENTEATELRLLGVFYPAGSPAVRYDPDRA
jgi:mannose-6-phosphate isomerase-like protein (cupin superfamily)